MNVNRKLAVFTIVIIAVAAGGIIASSAWPPPSPQYDHQFAMLVGISDYQGTEDDMDDSSERDARELHDHLMTSWPMSSVANIQLRTDGGATRNIIEGDFNTIIANAGPNDLTLIYWAGHGGWAGYDGEPIDENGGEDGALRTYYTDWGYRDDELAARINAIQGTKVVILDSCHMGAFADELDLPNTVTLLSTEESETAATYVFVDPIPLNHKAFSYHFNRAPDINNNGVISIEEAFAYAYPGTVNTAEANGQSQHPILIDNVPGEVECLGLR